MIDLDIDSVVTVAELKTKIETNFNPQLTTYYSSLQTSLNSMTQDSGQNCSVLGSVKSMAKTAEGQFYEDVKNASKVIEEVIGDILKATGDIIKKVQDSVDAAMAKVLEFTDWLGTQTDLIIAQAKAAINEVTGKINEVFSQVTDAIAEVMATIGDIASSMATAVKNILVRSCVSLSEAVGEVGQGAGIDEISEAVTFPVKDFVETNLSAIKSLTETRGESLGETSKAIPPGASQNAAIKSTFSVIDDLIYV